MFQSSSTPPDLCSRCSSERPVDKHPVDISGRTASVCMVKIPWCLNILTCVTAQLVVGLKGFGKRGDYIW